ncbi:MAG: hypothetical protein KDC05_05130 [Bacteroidales bacterium]|nr:hypothetical protein [Bacteroidales bacterium]
MKTTDPSHYKVIGKLFRYPDCTLEDTLRQMKRITNDYLETQKYIDSFRLHISSHDIDTLREYYISTFDILALCYLDIGYVLFGEDYLRGEFLVNLQAEYRKAGLSWGKELPDHLPNLLLLISKNNNRDFVDEFCWCLLIPALKEMIHNFNSETNVYKGLLQMLLIILEKDFTYLDIEQYHIKTGVKSDFLDCIGCSWKKSKKNVKTF